jgi:hypothetical protein
MENKSEEEKTQQNGSAEEKNRIKNRIDSIKAKYRIRWFGIITTGVSVILSIYATIVAININSKRLEIDNQKLLIDKSYLEIQNEIKDFDEKRTKVQIDEYKLKVYDTLSKLVLTGYVKPEALYMADIIMQASLPKETYDKISGSLTSILDSIDKKIKVVLYCNDNDYSQKYEKILADKRYSNVWIAQNPENIQKIVYNHVGYVTVQKHFQGISEFQKWEQDTSFSRTDNEERIDVFIKSKSIETN